MAKENTSSKSFLTIPDKMKRFMGRKDSSSDEEEDNQTTNLKKYNLPLTIVQPGDMKVKMRISKGILAHLKLTLKCTCKCQSLSLNRDSASLQTEVLFRDIGGYEEVKIEIVEFVNFFNQRELYTKLGARPLKGALLYGEPGNGKTLLARATAGEGNIPFISCSCASFLAQTNGPLQLRRVFNLARKFSPCILFFDEIDCIGKRRISWRSTPQSQSLTEELLLQLDGFSENDEKPVIVIGATNDFYMLDEALKRPGRFDRCIEISDPDLDARASIARIHLEPLKTSLDKDNLAKKIALLTDGFNGAKVAATCNEAAMIASRLLANEISIDHFDKALDRLRRGIQKVTPFTDKDKHVASFHEAGHAVVGWNLENVKPVKKLSIFPNAKGEFVCSLDQVEETATLTKKEICNSLILLLSGLAAEEITFGQYAGTGFADLEKATLLILDMSAMNGQLGPLGKLNAKSAFMSHYPYKMVNEENFQCGDKSIETAFLEMKMVINEAFEKAKSICVENQRKLEKVAAALREKNWLNLDELESILGPNPHINLTEMEMKDTSYLPPSLQNWNVAKKQQAAC